MKNLRNEFVLAAIPKDVKKGGAVCKNDSGSGLILKRGNRFVQIGMFFKLTKNYICISFVLRYCFWNENVLQKLQMAVKYLHQGKQGAGLFFKCWGIRKRYLGNYKEGW